MSDPFPAASRSLGAPRYAPWPLRAVSSLLDFLALLPAPLLAFVVIKALGLTDENGDPSPLGLVIWIPACLFALGFGLWNRVFLDGRHGQSLGRRATGTRLVGITSGVPIGPGMAFVRRVAHTLDGLPCACLPVGYLWPLWDEKHQTFADKLLGTIVVWEAR